jgi:hypothetical protein
MKMGKSLGLALAGGLLVLLAPAVARADEEPTVQDRVRQLEKQVQELRDQQDRRAEADSRPLASQVDSYLQEQEKGALWVDKNGKPLGKVVDSIWITAWLRGRPTWSDNYTDGDDTFNDNGFITFWRGGLGVGAKLKEKVSLYIGLDFAGTWGSTGPGATPPAMFTNDTPTTPTIQEAYVEGLYSKHLKFDTRIGRFEMQYGDEYVIGRTEFAQTSVYFDGVRLSKNAEKARFSYDVFAAKLVDGFSTTLNPSPNDSVYMAGFYGNFYGSEATTGLPGGLEPYYIWIWDGQQAPGTTAPTPRDIHTGGFRWYGEKASKDRAGIGWDINANLQFFKELMWSTDSKVHYSMPNMKYKPMVFGQFAYASGDHDGVTGYNPLWQDGHGRFGYGDFFAFTNLAVIGGGVHVTPSEGWDVGAELRSIHQARSTVVNSSKQLAWDLDFIVKHKYSDNVDVELVYSYIKMREALNGAGGQADDAQRAYLQVVVSF